MCDSCADHTKDEAEAGPPRKIVFGIILEENLRKFDSWKEFGNSRIKLRQD